MKKSWVFLSFFFLIVIATTAKQLVEPFFFLPTQSSANTGVKLSNYSEMATDLKVPWDIAFLPNHEILVTEREGNLVRIKVQNNKWSLIEKISVGSTLQKSESGLLGIVLHPQFAENQLFYLYTTVKKGDSLSNQIERYRYENGSLNEKTIIIENIPAAKYHDGGRMAFGPDGYLYITTGDAELRELAQDNHSLAGKLLRIKDDGSIPDDNPFGNAVYSYGHRNSQGITWDAKGRLWSTEHGDKGHDELNLIVKGGNYGWPIIQGQETKEGMISPLLESGSDEVWAPASAEYFDGSIFFGGLRGEALYEAVIGEEKIILKQHFKKEIGRIRTIKMGPDGFFYIMTSNTDGRGFPNRGDDKILRIDPSIFR